MQKGLEAFLKQAKRVTIMLPQLEEMLSGKCQYQEFASIIQELLDHEILISVNSAGTNKAQPPLPIKYRINRKVLEADLVEKIRQKRLVLHPLIGLDSYFKGGELLWSLEEGLLDKLNEYLVHYGLPDKESSVWQRSYEIFGDEKLISQKGGRAFLHRVGLYEKLCIADIIEPLMFTLNPARIHDEICCHLIVENKTTFDALIDILPSTCFLTMIYGAGKAFLNGIGELERQLHLPQPKHQLFYFGDIDYEGITIWYLLNKKRPAKLALPFYEALLDKAFTIGKQNQRRDETAYQQFAQEFTDDYQEKLQSLFAHDGYYPQEALSAMELKEIVRNNWWKHT